MIEQPVSSDVPLCVDLDGTLTYSDTLHDSVLQLVHIDPWAVFKLPHYLRRGKAVLKSKVAASAPIDARVLPYNEPFLEWLRQQRNMGRRLVLCTAADSRIARSVADYLDLFDEIFASDGIVNLSGLNKANALVSRFGEKGFDYAGNATSDLMVWRHARRAVVVNAASAGLVEKARQCCEVEKVFAPRERGFAVWRRVFRLHQWLKNGLLALPMLAAHQLTDWNHWWHLLLAFLAFSFSASAVYICNDLLDTESDRHHPRKRQRPFAAARVAVPVGVVLVPLLFMLSVGLGACVGKTFLQWLLVYLTVTSAYSFFLKRLVLIDCLVLAGLYTLRVIAGAAATAQGLSFWILAFSVFLFFSLAFVKRFAEMQEQIDESELVRGRGYRGSDAPLIAMLGVNAGYAAVVVLALYLNSAEVLELYVTPQWIWGAVLVLLFWVSWLWLQAYRGNMHDDPLVFAICDRVSVGVCGMFAVLMVLGSISW